MIRLLIVMFL
ncbi:unnamed protein product, partial [Cuscuta epithymum]